MNNYFLKQIRETKNISIASAASYIGIEATNLMHAEAGRRTLSEEKLRVLAAAYDVSASWFIDAPVVFSPAEIIFYLKRLYCLGRGQYKIYCQNGDIVLTFRDLEFIESWRKIKLNYQAGIITDADYTSWIYLQGGSGEHSAPHEKLLEIRRKRELEDPAVNNCLAEALGSLTHYLQIETGLVVPNKNEQHVIAEVLGYSSEFIFDVFSFFSQHDIRLFLLVIEMMFHVILVGPEGRIRIDMPEINMVLEKMLRLDTQFHEGKLTKAQYECGFIAL